MECQYGEVLPRAGERRGIEPDRRRNVASTYHMIAVICVLFYIIHNRKAKEAYVYTERCCVFWYVVTRLCIVLGTPNHITAIWSCIVLDLAIGQLFYGLLHKKLGVDRVRELIIKYVFWSGGMRGIPMALILRGLFMLLFYFMYAFMQTGKKYYLILDGVAAGMSVSKGYMDTVLVY